MKNTRDMNLHKVFIELGKNLHEISISLEMTYNIIPSDTYNGFKKKGKK